MPYILGVDGGNTKTIALIARRDGSIIGVGRGACSDMYGAGSSPAAFRELDLAVAAALDQAGVEAQQIESGVFSMAGADWPEDVVELEQAIHQRGYGQTVRVYNDAIGALRAGSPTGTGVVVACGTGAAIGSRAPDGRTWHLGFWYEYSGAGHLGQLAQLAIQRAELGLDPPTALTARILAESRTTSVTELLHRSTARNIARDQRPQKKRMARILLDVAAEGDPKAMQIVATHGRGLGEYALVAAQMVGIAAEPFTLVLTGGVFRHPSNLLSDALIAYVQSQTSGVRTVRSELEPVAGALLLALEQAGVAVSDPIRANLQASLPAATFFESYDL